MKHDVFEGDTADPGPARDVDAAEEVPREPQQELVKVASYTSHTSSGGTEEAAGGPSQNDDGAGRGEAVHGCRYYPGWSFGLVHCLNDCRQPTYMVQNPVFEFDTMDRCCGMHYEGTIDSCLAQTLQVAQETWNDEDGTGGLASIDGQVRRR